MTADPRTPGTALRRCPSEEHPHDRRLRALDRLHGPDGPNASPSSRGRAELDAVLDELERRRCAGGPLVLRDDGVPDRLEADGWIGGVLPYLPEDPPGEGSLEPSLDHVLGRMGIRTVEDLRAMRRLVAVHAALAALRWAAAPPSDAPSAAADLLLEIDDPSQAWT